MVCSLVSTLLRSGWNPTLQGCQRSGYIAIPLWRDGLYAVRVPETGQRKGLRVACPTDAFFGVRGFCADGIIDYEKVGVGP